MHSVGRDSSSSLRAGRSGDRIPVDKKVSVRRPGPTLPPIQWIPGLLPGGKVVGTWRQPPTPPSAKVKERVQLYLYSLSMPSWPVVEQILPFLPFCTALFNFHSVALGKFSGFEWNQR